MNSLRLLQQACSCVLSFAASIPPSPTNSLTCLHAHTCPSLRIPNVRTQAVFSDTMNANTGAG